jgi:F-type H+-transporting ATPase subunit a
VPGKFQAFLEMIVDVNRTIALEIIGPKGRAKFVPLLTTFFVAIFVLNFAKIFPLFMMPPTSRIAWPLFLAADSRGSSTSAWASRSRASPGTTSVGSCSRRGPQGALHHPDPDRAAVEPGAAAVHPGGAALRQHGRRPHPRGDHPGDDPRVPAVDAGGLDGGVFALIASPLVFAFELFIIALQAYIFTMLTAVYISSSMEAHH